MADLTTCPHGSRAIKIPPHPSDTYTTPTRRRRGSRYLKNLDRADSSDAGPSSSLGSDQDSWSSSSYARSPAATSHHTQHPLVSPLDKDPRLATSASLTQENTRKDKHNAIRSISPPHSMSFMPTASSPLGPSMLSSSSYKSVNLSSRHDDPDELPRLITYTKHSQGFTWNDELFLPSYLLGRYGGSGRGRKKEYDADFGEEGSCPVTEIFVTDEEAQALMP